MNLYQWLLFIHVTGAFFLIGGIVVAGILNLAAIVKDRRPSEVAALYGLIRFAVPLIGAGLLLTLVIGLWLVHNVGYGYGQTWIVAAIVLWAVGSALGNIDGKYQRQTGGLAQRLAAAGEAPSPRLPAGLLNPLPPGARHASRL